MLVCIICNVKMYEIVFFSSKNEQSNFCVFWCQFRVEGAILEKKVTSMTPIKSKVTYWGPFIARFVELFGQKVPKERFFRHHENNRAIK